MKRFRYETGVIVRIDGIRYRFISRTKAGIWQLTDLESNTIVAKPTAELNALYIAGSLMLDPEQDRERPTASKFNKILPPAIEDLPKAAQRRIMVRRKILDEVLKRSLPGTLNRKIDHEGKQTTILAKILGEICAELGMPTVSLMTYYRWKKLLSRSGSNMDLQGGFSNTRPARLHPRVRQIALEEMSKVLLEAADKQVVGKAPEVPMTNIIESIHERIRLENAESSSYQLLPPSRSTCYALWNSFPAYDRAVAKMGKTRARAVFRASPGQQPVERCLDKVEFDETRLPTFFFDEYLRIPLGRPWLGWYVDVCSQMPIGFYLGFERPSDLMITSALRHACLPKAYVKTEYPDIKYDYLGMGIPNFLVFDNGLSQWGQSIRDVTMNLNCPYDFTPARTPWFKATVEGMFRRLNALLLKKMPGFVLGSLDAFDYDPTKNGCLGLRHFLTIFHHWLIDDYCQRPTGFSKRSPSQRWIDGTADWEPDLLARSSDLDAVFGIVRENATLDHRGITYESIRYFSDDLQAFRYQFGGNKKVRVKVNPSDLGKVHVWLPVEKAWIAASVVPQMAYRAEGRSLHCVQKINSHATRLFDRIDDDTWRHAQWDLQKLIDRALEDALSIQTNSRIARFQGHGTDNLLGALDADGELGPLKGPYKGKRLNPLNDQSEKTDHASHGGDGLNVIRRHGKAERRIPKLRVDRSLGGGRDGK